MHRFAVHQKEKTRGSVAELVSHCKLRFEDDYPPPPLPPPTELSPGQTPLFLPIPPTLFSPPTPLCSTLPRLVPINGVKRAKSRRPPPRYGGVPIQQLVTAAFFFWVSPHCPALPWRFLPRRRRQQRRLRDYTAKFRFIIKLAQVRARARGPKVMCSRAGTHV